MGNNCCGYEVVFSEFIESNQFEESKEILKEQLSHRGREFITTHNLQLWKMKKGDKYYCGKFDKGRADGLALVYVPGYFKNGLPDGQGYLKSFNQAQPYQEYEGNFKQGMAQGHGKLSNSNEQFGFYFEGQWQNSEVIRGKLRSLNSSELDYIDFSKSGNFIQFKNGDTYEGDINNFFQPSGLGSFNYNPSNSTEKYVGEWQRGKFNGQGVCTWRDGSSYAGNYCNGEKQGTGKYVFTSKKYYEGNWLEGMQHGKGTLYDQDGTILQKGIWIKGKLELKIDDAEDQNHQDSLIVPQNNQLNPLT